MICAIHQPNFFPWLGYFDKIRRADVFVFLDDVAYGKSGSGMGSWTNRVQIDIQGRPVWFGCPVRRYPGRQAIREVEIDDSQPWRRRLLRTIEINYKRAPGFSATMELLQSLLERPEGHLASFNEYAVRAITAALGLECRFVRQSELTVTGRGTRLLIALTRAVGAGTYLCGGGATGYQEDELFAEDGIELVYQNFDAQPYRDPNQFLPGLSVIDYLMWTPDAVTSRAAE